MNATESATLYTIFYPRKSRGSIPWPSWPWTCAGRGIMRPTRYGGSSTPNCGRSRITPGSSCRRSRAIRSSSVLADPFPQTLTTGQDQAAGAGGARVVSAEPPAEPLDLRRLFQHGIHVERSFAHLLGRARQRGRRSAQGRQRPGRAGGRRGAALPARLFPPGDRPGRSATGALPLQRSRTVADHALAPGERRVVAAGDRPARLLGLAARLAGPGRQGEALSAGQQRRGELPGPPGDHQRAVRRRAGAAPAAGDGPRDRRMAAARRARPPAGGLPSERRARGLRRAGAGPRFHARRPGSLSTSRWPSPGRETCSRPTPRWPPGSTVSLRPSSSNTSAAMPSRSSASRSTICWPWAARTRTTRRKAFNMAYLAIRGSGAVNGVSRLHGKVSRHIFAPLFPRWPQDEVPVGHVTNGVHMPTWDSAAADDLWTEACGKDRWLGTTEITWSRTSAGVSDERLWQFRTAARKSLVEYARERLSRQLAASGASPEAVEAAKHLFDPNALTLGFARRFATYKRPNLLLHDPARLLRLLTNPERPVQLIIAGKAHPEDQAGQALIREWTHFIRRPEARPHVIFLSDYDMLLDRAPGAGGRRLDQHAAAALGGVRNERHEGARQRRHQSFGIGRLVGRSLYARGGMGSGGRPGAWRRSRLGRCRSRRALRAARARGDPGVLYPRRRAAFPPPGSRGCGKAWRG